MGEASGLHAGGAQLGSPCPSPATHRAPSCPPPPLVPDKPWPAGVPGPPRAQPPEGPGPAAGSLGLPCGGEWGRAKGESKEIFGFLVCLDAKISSWGVRGPRVQGFSVQAARNPRCPAKTVPKVSEPPR